MLNFILETLIEIGLIREDIKHNRKITKKEKEDGKKRSFQKHFLKPSVIVILSTFLIGITIIFSYTLYQRIYILPKKTQKEIREIADSIKNWKERYGSFPKDFETLISNHPMRQDWYYDAWDRPYIYETYNDSESFTIKSSGHNGIFNTKDDITMH